MNSNNDKKYFFFDIDGTLTTGFPAHIVPESTKRTLKALEEKGHFLAIATGRSQAMAEKILNELGFKNMVSDGGNGITLDGKLVSIDPLDREKCLSLVDELEEKKIPWAVSPDNTRVRYTKYQAFYDRANDSYMQTIVDKDLDINKFDKFFKLYIGCDREVDSTIEGLKVLPYARFSDMYLFVEPDDKSVGIKKIMDHFNAPYSDVVVFGDHTNDLKMFRDEWTSIAMGNAIPELKAKADFVTKSSSEDGIEYACKHFGWID
ncbi:HAD-IIB family hydrolase [Peptacetobacter hominis]|uniref:HAD-IIB family hydrolase n=1 Tax=Peptacetobacter hominis TaxID=2743610 RepID=A0A544QU51_9FIRM|nr:HAD-IIB family hydrolase [Peptacetobacter hominis]TQQ84225.1 HAD-IIB family hydrolase [Peptacetobacter hominis]